MGSTAITAVADDSAGVYAPTHGSHLPRMGSPDTFVLEAATATALTAALRVSFSRGGHDWRVMSDACMSLVVLYYITAETTSKNRENGEHRSEDDKNGASLHAAGADGGREVSEKMDGCVGGRFGHEHLVDAGIPAEVLTHFGKLEWTVEFDSSGTFINTTLSLRRQIQTKLMSSLQYAQLHRRKMGLAVHYLRLSASISLGHRRLSIELDSIASDPLPAAVIDNMPR